MKPADVAAAEASHAGGLSVAAMSPLQVGGWIVTLGAWIAVVAVPHASPAAGVIRSLAITLTLVSVMLACYEELRRAQQKAAAKILARQDEIETRMRARQDEVAERMEAMLAAATTTMARSAALQQQEIRHMGRKLSSAGRKRGAHAQENADEIGARLQHLTDFVEALSMLVTQEQETAAILGRTERTDRTVTTITALGRRR